MVHSRVMLVVITVPKTYPAILKLWGILQAPTKPEDLISGTTSQYALRHFGRPTSR